MDNKPHQAAAELERLQSLERARVADAAVYAAMSPEIRREFAEYRNKPRSDTSAEVVLGPAAWSIRRRLEATPPEWQADAEVFKTATSHSAGVFVAGKLKNMAQDIEARQQELDSIAGDYSKRNRINELERVIPTLQSDFERLSIMDPAQAYFELTAKVDNEAEAAQQRVDDQFSGQR